MNCSLSHCPVSGRWRLYADPGGYFTAEMRTVAWFDTEPTPDTIETFRMNAAAESRAAST